MERLLLKNNLEITEIFFKFVEVNDCLTIWRTKMISTEEKRRLNKELREECWGYSQRDNKPDGAYIKEKGKLFNLNKIKRLIEAGANVNAKDTGGRSPLCAVILVNGGVILAKYLISAGADVNSKDSDGTTLLHVAVDEGNIALVELLISSGADVNAKNKWGVSPLHEACYLDNIKIAKYLIDSGADVRAKITEYPWSRYERCATPLELAVDSKNIKLVKLLIKAGATE